MKLLLLFLTLSPASHALPEYALRNNLTRCTACHISPAGGGLRNLYGKAFGARGFELSPISQQDLLSAQLYGIYFAPKKISDSPGGAGLMAVNVGANLPLTKKTDQTLESRVVINANAGGFQTPTGIGRETYLRASTYEDSETRLSPQYYLLGRFQTPFGIMTDEHRTYTKMQSSESWNDFDIGGMFSANPSQQFHYDLGIANGTKTAGSTLGPGSAGLIGYFGNLRWMPTNASFWLGYSGSLHQVLINNRKTNPQASVIYTMIDLGKLTGLAGVLKFEYERARFWNFGLRNFVTDANYQKSVLDSESEGWWSEADIDLWPNWIFIYKFERLILDLDFPADFYERHSAGIRYDFGPNMIIFLRYEKATATHPSENIEFANAGSGVQDAYWGVMKIAL